MPNLYRNEASDPRDNAQRNLSGRTHYVDDDTLRWHKARILSARAVNNGLLFVIVESVALDPENRKRGCRYVIFDLFGHVVGKRAKLEDCWRRSEAATKAMWEELNTLNAYQLTRDAIERETKSHAAEMTRLREEINWIEAADSRCCNIRTDHER